MAAARSCEGCAAVWMIRSGLRLRHQRQDGFAIADIDRLVAVVRESRLQSRQHPAGVALGPEEHGSMVAVDSGDVEKPSRANERRPPSRSDRTNPSPELYDFPFC